MKTWQVQEAKTHLSKLIERARNEGPQTITRHGKASAVVVSFEEYEALKKRQGGPDLIDVLFHRGPKFDDFEIERDRDFGRDVDLDD
jgi:prevent-host-death family protein